MADPFNLVTQYERQLERGREPLQRFDASLQRGLEIGLQNRTRKLQEELLAGKIEEQKQQLSINEQLMQNPRKLIDEFGALKTTDERLAYIAKNAGIAATPAGQRVLDQLSGIADSIAKRETQSAVFQAKLLKAKKMAEVAARYGVDPTDPNDMAYALRADGIEQMAEEARKVGRELTAADIPDDAFDDAGRIDPKRRLQIINAAPLTPQLQFSEDRLKLAEGRADRPDLSAFGKMVQERNAAMLAGDRDTVRLYDAEMSEKGIQVRTNPDGTVEITQGAISPSGIEKTTKAQLEQKIMSQRELAEGLTRLLSTGAEKNFGVAGAVGSTLLDSWVANLPGMDWVANSGRIRDRALNNRLKNIAIRAVQDERGNLSEGDQRRINLLFPSDGVISVSPPKARVLWSEMLGSVKNTAKRSGETIGRPELWAYSQQELLSLPDLFPETVTNEQIAAELNRRGVPKR